MNPKTKSIKKIKATAPYCFLSYSSKEPQIGILIPCLWIAFSPHFELKLTPSALESGASQRAQIVELIKGCTFAVVALDGLRPNVTFEYGLLEALNKPVILLKEKDATVDIRSYLGDAVTLGVTSPKLTVDSHFSNVKDLNYAEWNRLDPAGTVKLILQEYRKKKSKLQTFIRSLRLKSPHYGLHEKQAFRIR
jgi:nucleoside 2-deoxyribosyltransferase